MSSKPVILCIDDQPSNLQIRAILLAQFGCAVLTAGDHRTTLRIVSENPVDLVIIDYHLGKGETGEEVARDVRVIRPRLPIIMLTGDSRLPQSACDLVDEVLIKGASDPRMLFALIRKLLPNAEMRQPRAMLVKEPQPKNSAASQAEAEPDKAS